MARQRTIKGTVEVKGIGLQTGAPVTLRLKSSPANSGINFIRTDLSNKPLLNIQSFFTGDAKRYERRTTLELGPIQIQTTEHLLAAISGLAIDNIVIEMDNMELPGLDGSALGFVEAIMKSGFTEEAAPRREIKIEEVIFCKDGGSFLGIFPDDKFSVSYTLSYQSSALGTQFYSNILTEDVFVNEIAPARTFCLEEEALALLKMGLGKGAGYDNTLVMGNSGPINNKLRFPNEPVRHKVLDLLGDLCLVGSPLIGRVIAIKSGHKLNMELVRELKARSQTWVKLSLI